MKETDWRHGAARTNNDASGRNNVGCQEKFSHLNRGFCRATAYGRADKKWELTAINKVSCATCTWELNLN